MNTGAAESSQPAESAAAPKRRTSPRRVATFAVFVLAAAFILDALVHPSPRVPLGILTATADKDEATDDRQQGEISPKAWLAAHAAKLQSDSNVTASDASSYSDTDRLCDRALANYNLQDNLLMQRVGLALFEQLRDDGRFQQIHYLPLGEKLPDGQRLPEIFVTLDRDAWQANGLPG